MITRRYFLCLDTYILNYLLVIMIDMENERKRKIERVPS